MLTTTSTDPFRAVLQEVGVTLVTPMLWTTAWSGTSDNAGMITDRVVLVNTAPTSWSVAFESSSPTAAEEVARLRDRISEAAGLNKQEIARGIGVDRRSLSGFVAGEIRPTEPRLRALNVLADAAEWAAARFGTRASDVLRQDSGKGSPLDLIASGRTGVMDEIQRAAEALGLMRRGALTIRERIPRREPLYVNARAKWSNRLDKPAAGGRVRDPAVYEQDLSQAPPSQPTSGRPRRKQI